MATRQILAELAAAFEEIVGVGVNIESTGGVDAAKRVAAGEAFDIVVLASDAIDGLIAGGRLKEDSKVDLARSGIAVAVRAGAVKPDLSTADRLRAALRSARRIGYSTGPSGTSLVNLLTSWGLLELLNERATKAPPGVPVGSLVARGDVDLGFQQLSELMHLPGVDLVGMLPPDVQIWTTFSAALSVDARHPAIARDLLAYLASPEASDAKRRQGMEPA